MPRPTPPISVVLDIRLKYACPFKPTKTHKTQNPKPKPSTAQTTQIVLTPRPPPQPLSTRKPTLTQETAFCIFRIHIKTNTTKMHASHHYRFQRQLEHGTINRLLLHLLIRHIILPNHMLHSAACTPPSATFWKLYLPEELSSSARTSIRCKPS